MMSHVFKTASADALVAALAELGGPHPGTLVIAPPDSARLVGRRTMRDHRRWRHLAGLPGRRLPVDAGRGYANVIARSDDGLTFETVAVVNKETFGAESLERPALVVTPEGMWRLYVSCATPGTAHWRVDLLEAATAEGLAHATPRTVLPGGRDRAVKDPVRHALRRRLWHLWASVHPLSDPDATDRMSTEHATSPDGIDWTWTGQALGVRAGQWDSRGVRITSVLQGGGAPLATYDGRASAAENWEERTGVAVGQPQDCTFRAVGLAPARFAACRWRAALPKPGHAARRDPALLSRGHPPRRRSRTSYRATPASPQRTCRHPQHRCAPAALAAPPRPTGASHGPARLLRHRSSQSGHDCPACSPPPPPTVVHVAERNPSTSCTTASRQAIAAPAIPVRHAKPSGADRTTKRCS